MCKMTIGCHHRNECQNSRIGWFIRMVVVRKNGCADLIDRSAISSSQQKVLGL